VIRRMIDKWLKAGVLEEGLLRHATEGSPQGGVTGTLVYPYSRDSEAEAMQAKVPHGIVL
jgi:hypothetical protein